MYFAGKTVFITGASRGIGQAIAMRLARDGANIVLAAKTADPHPKLPGTIYSAAKEIEEAGGNALPCVVDVRDEDSVETAVKQAVDKFSKIDILVNNASAISLTGTLQTPMKRFDLMHQINTRGTYLVSQKCIPHMIDKNNPAENPHILNISPPLNMHKLWFANHVAYTMAKYGMSMCVLGMAEEFKAQKIAVNALWPRTAIWTAAMEMLGGDAVKTQCRTQDIMADAAYELLKRPSDQFTGHFVIDDEILQEEGVTNFDKYAIEPGAPLMPDFFLGIPGSAENISSKNIGTTHKEADKTTSATSGDVLGNTEVDKVFEILQKTINRTIVEQTKAVYAFDLGGDNKYYIDLANDVGSCGKGTPSKADATFEMKSDVFISMFQGKTKPTTAFMTGKLKIKGNMGKALKLEKLMAEMRGKLS